MSKVFIEKVNDAIGDMCVNNGILKSLVIAQAILESGWGTSSICTRLNNYFGLNWYNDEVCKPYKYVSTQTAQWNGTRYVETTENFCKFNDLKQSIECLMRWYTMREKYKFLINNKDFESCAKYLTGKYATSPTYATNLIRLYNQYNLSQYDKETVTPTPSTFYYVQAGAFVNKDGVNKITSILTKIRVEWLVRYDGKLYRVQAGAFSKEGQADRRVELLKKNGVSAFKTTSIVGKEVNV